MALVGASSSGFPARFRSECSECFGRIEEGDLIQNAGGEYRHVDCPDEPIEPKPTRFQGTTLDDMGY